MFAVCADQKEYHDSPEPMMRCLTAAPGRGFPRAAPTEITGIPMWTPGILPDAAVTEYLRQAREATSPFSDFNQEFVLTLLANNGYDIDQALPLYKYIQNSINRKFVDAAGIDTSPPSTATTNNEQQQQQQQQQHQPPTKQQKMSTHTEENEEKGKGSTTAPAKN